MEDTQVVQQNLEMQLAEVEMLQSMYSEDELKFSDPTLLADIRDWIGRPAPDCQPPSISFVICLDFEAHVSFPTDYPKDRCAKVFVRSQKLTREGQQRLNKSLTLYMESIFVSEGAVVCEAVSWLNEHFGDFIPKDIESDCDKGKKPIEELVAGRLWLYSHHIYSKVKRKNILDLCKDNELTGFCMPGKPGIVCLEGPQDVCNDVWAIIKQWTWKKISVRYEESEKLKPELLLSEWRKFDKFEEVGFVKAETRDYHMDMGQFSNFLQTHGVDYMFKELFGMDKS